MNERPVSVSTVIACYTEARWGLLIRAIDSVRAQTLRSNSIVVVVDHNEGMYHRLAQFVPDDVTVVENTFARGAGGARNTGVLCAPSDLIAFLDDDINTEAIWLEELVKAMRSGDLLGAGGPILPEWERPQPSWFPMEFGWVLGLRAGPKNGLHNVRNVWSANMIVNRASFVDAGGFRADFGKIGNIAEPEDTELCLRLTRLTGLGWGFVPRAVVFHHVPSDRSTLRYFVHRCWMEGAGKAAIWSHMEGDESSLSDERNYLIRTIPAAIVQNLRVGLREPRYLGQLACMLLGVSVTCISFAWARRPSRPGSSARSWRTPP